MKRTFFALKVSEDTKNVLNRITQDFPEFQKKVKIANPENPHITIKFLGNTENKLIEEIDAELKTPFQQLIGSNLFVQIQGAFQI